MKIKTKEFVIPGNNPFEHDVLDRNNSADILTNILLSVDEPFVLSIDSPWGTGKSTFIKMWRQELINKGFPTIYYNAWESDFSDDPLVTLISEIETGIEELRVKFTINKTTIQKFHQVKKIGSKFIKKGIPLALKLATYGVVDINEAAEKSIANFIEDYAKESLKNYEASKHNLVLFRKKLSEFVCELMKIELCKEKPLIIFIDELDRCRPNFAIEVLEKAKHFFNINGIIFILSIDKEQIKNSISSIYGLNMKISGYLNRFIDLSYNLQQPNNEKFVHFLFDQYELDKFFSNRTHHELQYDWEHISFIFYNMSSIFNLSLRDQIQCFTQLTIALRTVKSNNYIFGIPFVFLIILKFVNAGLYFSYIKYQTSGEDVIRFMEKQKGNSKLLNSKYGYGLIAYLIWLSKSNYEDKINFKQFENIVNDENATQEEKYKANQIITDIQSFNNKYPWDVLKIIIDRIEILEKFNDH